MVTACAVTPDGRRVVSASDDKTLKVWDLQAGACLFTHRTNATCRAIATTTTAIIAGDAAGAVWFLDWPSPDARQGSAQDDRRSDNQPTPSALELPAHRPLMKHTILFLTANPFGTDRIALDREARAIQVELERSGFRDRFELVTRWAAEPLDLLRELRKLKPTVVHFSGHGTSGIAGRALGSDPHRDVDIDGGRDPRPGLFFQATDGGPQLVSTEALETTFGAAGSSVQLIVLNACYSELNAQALLRHVGCVVGMSGAIADNAARSFAIGFYGGLGERESIAAAYAQGCAAIGLQGLSDRDRPKLAVRAGIDAGKLVLAADLVEAPASQAGRSDRPVASPPAEETVVTRDELLTRLSRLLPAQFEEVLYRANIPPQYIPGSSSAQAMRAIAALRYMDQQNQFEQLARIVRQVVTGHGTADTDHRARFVAYRDGSSREDGQRATGAAITQLAQIVGDIRNQLGETPWMEIAKEIQNAIQYEGIHEFTLPDLISFADQRRFSRRDVHVVVEKLTQGGILERVFLPIGEGIQAVIPHDVVVQRLRASLHDEEGRSEWLKWARGVRVVWRLRQDLRSRSGLKRPSL